MHSLPNGDVSRSGTHSWINPIVHSVQHCSLCLFGRNDVVLCRFSKRCSRNPRLFRLLLLIPIKLILTWSNNFNTLIVIQYFIPLSDLQWESANCWATSVIKQSKRPFKKGHRATTPFGAVPARCPFLSYDDLEMNVVDNSRDCLFVCVLFFSLFLLKVYVSGRGYKNGWGEIPHRPCGHSRLCIYTIYMDRCVFGIVELLFTHYLSIPLFSQQ